jgi:GNAT superfamily N-acetyltransferase
MYQIRSASLEEASIIVEQRCGMFVGMGFPRDAQMAKMAEEFLPWLKQKMAAGQYMAWFAEANGTVVAGSGLLLIEWPPHLIGRSSHRGYILNIYTHPDHRRKGLAKRLTQAAVDWCRANGIEIVFLHASEQGRPVYESMGFKPGPEMRLKF